MSLINDGACDSVLFDLDGTLIDTAPDMVAVLQDLQRTHDREPVSYDTARLYVSNGALGLLTLAFPEAEHYFGSPMHLEYLDHYSTRVCQASHVFPELIPLLDALDSAGCPWGVVTNKPGRLTDALLEALSLSSRVACVVSGDSLPQRKPDPLPLLHACDIAGLSPQTSVYAGDASRDIEAGRNAGMPTVAAAYGYIMPDDDPYEWGADEIAADAAELAQIVRKAVNLDNC